MREAATVSDGAKFASVRGRRVLELGAGCGLAGITTTTLNPARALSLSLPLTVTSTPNGNPTYSKPNPNPNPSPSPNLSQASLRAWSVRSRLLSPREQRSRPRRGR